LIDYRTSYTALCSLNSVLILIIIRIIIIIVIIRIFLLTVTLLKFNE